MPQASSDGHLGVLRTPYASSTHQQRTASHTRAPALLHVLGFGHGGRCDCWLALCQRHHRDVFRPAQDMRARVHAPGSMAACIWSTISTFSSLAAAPHRAGLLLSITEQTPSRSKQGEMYLDDFAKLKTAGRQALMPQAASLHIQVDWLLGSTTCRRPAAAGGLPLRSAFCRSTQITPVHDNL